MLWRAAVTLVAAASIAVADQPAVPRARIVSNAMEVSLPAKVLRDGDMQKQLTNGLTTVIITSIDDRGRGGESIRGSVRVEIRFDLWDETYTVGAVDLNGRKAMTFATIDKLAEWWTSAALRIATIQAGDAPAVVHIRTDVVPFSAAEEADAQRWLMHSMNELTSPPASQRAPASSANQRDILGIVIGTGVQRKPIKSWRWTVPVAAP